MSKNIKNIENIKEICVYNMDNTQYHLIENMDGSIKTNRGFFTKVEGDIYGVMESTRGPVFFHNEKTYYLLDADYEFYHQHLEEKTGKFQLTYKGKVCEDVTYKITTFTDYDAWSAEKDVDFFQWICQSQENELSKERFHAYYTECSPKGQ